MAAVARRVKEELDVELNPRVLQAGVGKDELMSQVDKATRKVGV